MKKFRVLLRESSNQNLERSLEIVNEQLPSNLKLTSVSELPVQELLSLHPVSSYVGGGKYGKVFGLSGLNRVIKFFYASPNLEKDIARFEKTISEMYTNSEKTLASLEDMHYFEYGKIKEEPQLFYVIMPKIVPFETSEEFKNNSTAYKDLFRLLYHFDRGDRNNQETYQAKYSTYSEFLQAFQENLKVFFAKKGHELPEEQVVRIVKATWRARTKYGGRDLHYQNMGFYDFNPKIYFFFDM